ncbi:hypothetical protein [Gemmatirosa kalamazoonensis]|uniref:hypothetical protein n=1 Tax=Gemmatirosa kalamazoonensis TaxID=861299 RepID=UPI0011DE4952|nr:hypothetical protein [Gemmatirosa kalamazoonensis]
MTIPIGGGSAGSGAAAGINIPLGIGVPALGTGASTRETQILRAVAAAAALEDPANALELARQARDDPGSVVAPTIDAAKLALVVDAVDRRRTDGTGAPSITALHTAAAGAIGASAALVAAGDAVLADRTNGSLPQALAWVASIDATLLERAALAGERRRELDRIAAPAATVVNDRIDQLETRVGTIDTRVTSLDTRVTNLDTRLTALEARVTALETS